MSGAGSVRVRNKIESIFTLSLPFSLFSFLIIALIFCVSANATVIFGPISSKSSCPGSGRGQTQGNVKYCYFDDPRIVQVLNAPCPAGLAGATSSSTGNQKWCVIRKQ
jgi:hypothetical protein